MSTGLNGKPGFAEQLVETGVQIGWNTRLVPFGPDTSSVVFSIGFATRAAMSFGNIKPGDFRKILIYNKDRIFAFVLPFGYVDEEWYANALGAVNFGFPVIADTPIPQILPTGVCTYEHVVSGVPYDQLVPKAVEVRGLKVKVTKVPIPVSYSPAYEGERVSKDDLVAECGGGRTPAVELTTTPRDGRGHRRGHRGHRPRSGRHAAPGQAPRAKARRCRWPSSSRWRDARCRRTSSRSSSASSTT